MKNDEFELTDEFTAKEIEVFKDSISHATPCTHPKCHRPIIWSVVTKTGKKMCFDHPTVPIRLYDTEFVPVDAPPQAQQVTRTVAVMPFSRNHWASCPGREDFKRKS